MIPAATIHNKNRRMSIVPVADCNGRRRSEIAAAFVIV